MSGEVRVQDLLGRQVRAGNNQSVGRIEEIRVEKRGKGYVVREYHLGAAALVERLSAHVGSWFGRSRQMRVVAWDQIDLQELSNWIVQSRLDVRLQLQLHKYIWGPDVHGV